jgi:hypothetical protein
LYDAWWQEFFAYFTVLMTKAQRQPAEATDPQSGGVGQTPPDASYCASAMAVRCFKTSRCRIGVANARARGSSRGGILTTFSSKQPYIPQGLNNKEMQPVRATISVKAPEIVARTTVDRRGLGARVRLPGANIQSKVW